MWQSLKIGAAVLACVGLIMSGLAAAHAVDGPGAATAQPPGTEQVVLEALAPLLDDGTLTQEQADAVARELAPVVARARFEDETRQLARQFGRLGAEIAEVLGITPDDLGERLQAGITLAEIAEIEGSTGEELVTQVTEHIAAHFAVRVTAGKLDQPRAEEIVASTEQTLRDLLDVEHPFGTVIKERRNRAIRVAGLEAASDLLGLSVDEVRVRLEEGATLAQVAEAEEVREDDLMRAILAPLIDRVEQAVERGRLTDGDAVEVLEKATERVAEAIHQTPGS